MMDENNKGSSNKSESKAKSLEDELKDFGLDVEFWVIQLREIDITEYSQLKNVIDEDSFKAMLESARHIRPLKTWELSRLRKCFNLPEIKIETPKGKTLEGDLEEYGLDVAFWLKQLKEIEITNYLQLKNVIDEDSFKGLLESAKEKKDVTNWEQKRLRKCFDLPEIETKKEECETPDLGTVKENLNKAVKKLDTEHAKQEEILEQKMQQNKEWLRKESTPKQEILQAVQAPESKGSVAISRENQSDMELIKRISAGMVLKGYYLSNDRNASIECKEMILKCPETVTITNPTMTADTYEFNSYSREEAHALQHALKHGGHGVAASLDGGGWEFKADTSAGYKKESSQETQSIKQSTTNFACKTQYSVIPTKAFVLNQDDYKLSQASVNALRDIESCLELDKSVVDEKCEMFFDKFGSHYYSGTYHFGGIYQRIAEMNSIEIITKTEAQKWCQTAMDLSLKAGYSRVGFNVAGGVAVAIDAGEAFGKKEKEVTESSEVSTRLCKIGGPQEIDEYLAWKKGLVSQTDTWHVIDRGDLYSGKYEGVWKLILNDTLNFQDPILLALVVMEAWKSSTGIDNDTNKYFYINILDKLIEELTGDSHHEDKLLCTLKNLDKVTDKINETIRADDTWVTKCKKDVKDVLQKLNETGSSPEMRHRAEKLLEKANKRSMSESTDIKIVMDKLEYAQQTLKTVKIGDVQGREKLQKEITEKIREALQALHDTDFLQFVFIVTSFRDLGNKMFDFSEMGFKYNLSQHNVNILLESTKHCCKDFIAFSAIISGTINTNISIACLKRLVDSLKVISVDSNFSEKCLNYLTKDIRTQEFLEVVARHVSKMEEKKESLLELLMELVDTEHGIGLRKWETIFSLLEKVASDGEYILCLRNP